MDKESVGNKERREQKNISSIAAAVFYLISQSGWEEEMYHQSSLFSFLQIVNSWKSEKKKTILLCRKWMNHEMTDELTLIWISR